MAISTPIESRPQNFAAWLRSGLLLNLAATLVSFTLNEPWRYRSWGVVWLQLLGSAIYSNCIGTLIMLGLWRWRHPIARRPFPYNWLLLGLLLMTGAVLGCLLAEAIGLGLGARRPGNYWANVVNSLKLAFVIGLGFGVSAFLYENLRSRLLQTENALRIKELEEAQARRLLAETRLASLESRLQPHFLFNTLNSVSALVREDPLQAEKMVEQLAALLRYALAAGAQNTVPLRRELEMALAYLAIEQIRFGPRLQFTADVPESLQETQTPPFALQTLVENSVKHVAARRPGGVNLHLSARDGDGRLVLRVSDDGEGFAPDAIAAGHGLDNLQQRLQHLYGAAGELTIKRETARTIVEIAHPL